VNLGGTCAFRRYHRSERENPLAAFRYIVHDVDACVPVYRDILGFEVKMQATGFAALARGDLTLFLNQPGMGSAGKAGGNPEPGGWNRFQIEVSDLDATVEDLKAKGATFKGETASGAGGRQILVQDPSGNVVEFFERAAP
jgi:catechol 2,3-dioxygenase-like lactoylglutathione lyase family enzyme